MSHTADDELAPWPIKTTRSVGCYPIFSIRTDIKTSPRTGSDHGFYVIECSDWVNVIAVTPDDHLVMIKQYRHGSGSVELEIPGGVMEPEDVSPVDAAIRELREETGYEGQTARLIGDVYPNPAIMSNTCRTVLIEGCESKHPRALDPGEDIVTELVPLGRVRAAVAEGRVSHALVIVALYYFDLDRAGNTRS
ncbi:MAG: Methanol dehydrogenase activator [Verrucomicrobia subdivision 3 bacterium]|nr:Methanol dehydrogenase activator [Limisphaerales bacterium]MCS1413644.1 Methanol dehydrogenase activator [Limisphaerales bacterium]